MNVWIVLSSVISVCVCVYLQTSLAWYSATSRGEKRMRRVCVCPGRMVPQLGSTEKGGSSGSPSSRADTLPSELAGRRADTLLRPEPGVTPGFTPDTHTHTHLG